MPSNDMPLKGMFRDVLRDASGATVWDRGWINNTIMLDCRRLLATSLRGTPAATAIKGVAFGAGNPAWDAALPPVPKEDAAFADGAPHLVLATDTTNFKMDFVNPTTGEISPNTPTRALQIRVTLGPNQPPWPETPVIHPSSTLREFGLFAELEGKRILINYRTHVAIAKDKASTLERTIWLMF